MTVIVATVMAAFVLTLCGPSLVTALVRPGTRPAAALSAWALLVGAIVALLAAATALALFPSLLDSSAVRLALSACVTGHLTGSAVSTLQQIGLGAVPALMLIRLAWVAAPLIRRTRRSRSRHLCMVHALAQPADGVQWIDGPTPMAYSVGGRAGTVIATTAVRGLDADLREAVLAHERAHLRGRHHLLVLAADIVAAAWPWLPISRRSPELVRTLVELAADDGAAHRAGASNVMTALLQVSRAAVATPGALHMSGGSVPLRLAWLSARPARRRLGPIPTVPLAALVAVFALPAVLHVYCAVC